MDIDSDLRNDLGLWRGWAVFEAIEARGNVLFHWEDHYIRLVNSCLEAHIPFDHTGVSPMEGEMLQRKVIKEIELRGYKRSLIKILITRGSSSDHKTPIPGSSKILIDVFPFPNPLDRPLKLEVQNGIREFPRIKLAGGYGYTMIRGEMAAAHGCDDFLYSSPATGITESSMGNVFFIYNSEEFGSTLYTPDKEILEGVTRQIVLYLAVQSKLFYRIEDGTVPFHVSNVCHFAPRGECFITSTGRGVLPIESITDLRGYAYQFKTGPETVTEKLKALFEKYKEEYFITNQPR